MSVKKNIMYLHCLFLLIAFSCNKQDIISLDRDDFSIDYPSYLELDESGEEGIIFSLKTPQKGESDMFIENINLATKKADNIQFDEYVVKTEKEISSIAEIVEKKRLKLGGKDCLRLVFKLTQNNVEYTFIQHLFVENQKIYALTFSSEAKEYENYFEDMNKVMMSFRIK